MFRAVIATSFAAILAACACAQDVNTARYQGMGGAGLALPIDVGSRGSLNPSLYGFESKHLTLDWPQVGYHAQGVTIPALRRDLGSFGSGALNAGRLTRIARDLGTNNIELGAVTELGLGMDGFHVGVETEALVSLIPNAPLRREAASGTFTDLNDNLDAYGYGYYSVDLGFGHDIPLGSKSKDDTLMVGARARLVTAYYAHRSVSGNQILQSESSTPGFGAEMDGQKTLNKSGLGMDLGLDFSTDARKLYFGAVVRNLVEPKVGFDGTLPDEQGFGIPGEVNFNPFKRQFDVGVGYMPYKKLALAADMVDIGNNGSHQEFRIGVDYAVNRWFNLQAGYGSRRSFAVGFGVGFFNIAIGPNLPLTLSSVFRF
jgi:hypothetical protein